MDRNYREMFVRIFIEAILIASLGALAACGGGGGSSPPPPTTPTAFSLVAPTDTSIGVVVNPQLTWVDSSGETSYTVQISDTPAFSAPLLFEKTGLAANTTSFTVPAGVLRINTQYHWRVIAANAQGTTTAAPFIFTTNNQSPASFSLVTPADATLDVSLMPDLAWTDAIGASLYTVEMSTDASFASSIASFATAPTITHYTVSPSLQEWTTYYWRVLASNPTGTTASNASFLFKTKKNGAPDTFHLVSPADTTTDTLLRPDLTWSGAFGVTTYTVQLATNSGFTTGLRSYPNISSSITTFTVPSDLAETTTYYWNVLASNPSGTTNSAETWTFTTKRVTAPSAFALTSPTDGATGVSHPLTLAWNDAAGETSYTLQISTDNFATTPYAYENTAIPANATSYTLSAGVLAGGVKYSWRVIAVNAIGQTTSTNAPFNFTTKSATKIWDQASNPSPIDDEPYGTAVVSGGSLYVVGYDSNTTQGDDQWRIENRSLSDGSLVASFGTSAGVVVSNPSGTSIFSFDDAYAIAADSTAMYVVGFDSAAGTDNWEWRIEKRDLVTGASVTAFGTDGAIQEDISAFDDSAFAVAVDSRPTGTLLYVVGYEGTLSQGTEWRIEALDKETGASVSSVSTSLSTQDDGANAIAIDPVEGYMYVVGSDYSSGNEGWRVEKRTLSAPMSLETTTFNGGTGFIYSQPSTTGGGGPYAVDLDSTSIYIAGDEAYGTGIHRWRIEKRDRYTGALDATFGTGGVVKSTTTTNAGVNAMAIDGGYMYIAGFDNTASGHLEWRIEKRSLADGSLDSSFAFGGVAVYDFGSPTLWDSARAIAVDSSYIYVAGYETVSGSDSRWRIMTLVK